jgi:hypothetical protein
LVEHGDQASIERGERGDDLIAAWVRRLLRYLLDDGDYPVESAA